MKSLISIEDAEALIALVATAGDPTVEKSVAARKSELLEGLQRLVGADVSMWNTGTINPDRTGDAMAVHMIERGWRSDDERTAFLEATTNPAHTVIIFAGLHEALASGKTFTMSRNQVMDDETWARSAAGQDWRRTGLDQFIISAYPLGFGGFSAIGLHRRIGKPDFTERDRTLVHMLCRSVDWLHREGGQVPASEMVIELSPRERQVVLLLVGGDGRKQVAAKLKISEHTVTDYLKAIYRKFGVRSRGELLGMFISGR